MLKVKMRPYSMPTANCPNFAVELLRLPLIHVVPCVQIRPFKAGANPMALWFEAQARQSNLSMPVVWVVIHPEKAGPKSSSLDSSHGHQKHHPIFQAISVSSLWITKIWIGGSPRPTPACHLAHWHWTLDIYFRMLATKFLCATTSRTENSGKKLWGSLQKMDFRGLKIKAYLFEHHLKTGGDPPS